MLNFNYNLKDLTDEILKRECVNNILVKTKFNYHIVNGSVIDFEDDEYTFYFEGYGFNIELDEIKAFIILD